MQFFCSSWNGEKVGQGIWFGGFRPQSLEFQPKNMYVAWRRRGFGQPNFTNQLQGEINLPWEKKQYLAELPVGDDNLVVVAVFVYFHTFYGRGKGV